MPIKLLNCHANLNEFPKIQSHLRQITIGDIHGNAQYLLYLLIKFNVLEMSEKWYNELIGIYNQKTGKLNADQIMRFRYILKNAKYNPDKSLLFLGDTLSDRGKNDYFTLCIFRRLSINKVPFTILLANHDYEFLSCYEKMGNTNSVKFESKHIKESQASSINNLQKLLQLKLRDEQDRIVIDFQNLKKMIKHHLIAHYKALDYNVEGNNITIFSHAPVDINIIRGIAGELGVNFNDESTLDLAISIDGINQTAKDLLMRKELCSRFKGMFSSKSYSSVDVDPLTRLIWNRDYDSLDHRMMHKGYSVHFVHGHDTKGEHKKNVISLDKMLGKTSKHFVGELHFLIQESSIVCTENVSPQLSTITAGSKFSMFSGTSENVLNPVKSILSN